MVTTPIAVGCPDRAIGTPLPVGLSARWQTQFSTRFPVFGFWLFHSTEEGEQWQEAVSFVNA